MRCTRCPYPGGFTLVEILVVCMIIGIAGAIIVPQISSRDDLKTSAAARSVMADLIYAQNLAITRQKNQYVVFDLTAGTYTVVSAPDMSTVTHPVNHSPYVVRFGSGGSSGLQQTRLVSASFLGQGSTSSATIGFDELGTPLMYPGSDPAQTMTSGSIVLETGDYRLKIDIEPYTGLITVNPAP